MSGNDGPDLPRHLSHLGLDAVEHMLATLSRGPGQPVRSAAGTQEQRCHRKAGKTDLRARDCKTEELLASIEFGLLAGVQRRPLFAAHRVHQHHPGHFLWIVERKAAHHQPAKGMSHQNVGRLDAGFLQQLMQFGGDVAGVRAVRQGLLQPSPPRS